MAAVIALGFALMCIRDDYHPIIPRPIHYEERITSRHFAESRPADEKPRIYTILADIVFHLTVNPILVPAVKCVVE